MQPIVYHVATSVDGFIAGPGGTVDRFSSAGDHVEDYLRDVASYSAAVMGRKTYQFGVDHGVTDPYPQLETYVFSRSLQRSPHPHVTLVSGEVTPVLERLRAGDGKGIYLVGGGILAKQALAAGLIDELVLKLNPLLLGDGVPLFEGGISSTGLVLRSTKVHHSGVTVLRYTVRR
jgi:dihydrofolate reductase